MLWILFTTAFAQICNVLDFGAVGNGKVDDSAAVKRAIEACRGGGEVLLPADYVFLTRPQNLTSNMRLRVEGVLLGSANVSQYPNIPALPSYCQGRDIPGPRYGALVGTEHNVRNVSVEGRGTIDGQGTCWWAALKAGTLKHTRPRLVEPMFVEGVRVADVTLKNSPFWTLHPYACRGVEVAGVTVDNPMDVGNTDGVDPDSSTDVHIHDCTIKCGDDGVAVKSGWNWCGRKFARPSANILIERNKFVGSQGVAIGSEMSGGVFNVTVRNNVFSTSTNMANIKTARGRGGTIADVVYSDNLLMDVTQPLHLTMYYDDGPPTNASATPTITRVAWHNIRGSGSGGIAGNLHCLPERPCNHINMSDVDLIKTLGYQCSNAYGTQSDCLPKFCLKASSQ